MKFHDAVLMVLAVMVLAACAAGQEKKPAEKATPASPPAGEIITFNEKTGKLIPKAEEPLPAFSATTRSGKTTTFATGGTIKEVPFSTGAVSSGALTLSSMGTVTTVDVWPWWIISQAFGNDQIIAHGPYRTELACKASGRELMPNDDRFRPTEKEAIEWVKALTTVIPNDHVTITAVMDGTGTVTTRDGTTIKVSPPNVRTITFPAPAGFSTRGSDYAAVALRAITGCVSGWGTK